MTTLVPVWNGSLDRQAQTFALSIYQGSSSLSTAKQQASGRVWGLSDARGCEGVAAEESCWTKRRPDGRSRAWSATRKAQHGAKMRRHWATRKFTGKA